MVRRITYNNDGQDTQEYNNIMTSNETRVIYDNDKYGVLVNKLNS